MGKIIETVRDYWAQITAGLLILVAVVTAKADIGNHSTALDDLKQLNLPVVRQDVADLKAMSKDISTSLHSIDKQQGEQGRDIQHIKEQVDKLQR